MDDQSEMMYCPSCGERIRRSVNFCRFCGEPNRKQSQGEWGPDQGDSRQRHHSREQGQYRSGKESTTGPQRESPQRPRSGRQGPGEYREHGEQRTSRERRRSEEHQSETTDELGTVDESGLRVLGIGIGLGLLAMALLVVFTVVGSVPVAQLGVPTPAALLFGTVIGQYVGFMGLSLWYLRYRGLDWQQVRSYLGIRKPTLKQLGLILGAWLLILAGSMVIGLVAEFAADFLGSGDPGQAEQDITQILADNPGLVPLAIIMMFLVVGPCEEILFRGVIQGRLREHFSAGVAIGVTSVFFGSLHVAGIGGSLEGIILALSVLTLAGAVLGSLYEYTQNLVVVALLHGFHNSMVVLFIYASEVYDLESAIIEPLLVAIPI